ELSIEGSWWGEPAGRGPTVVLLHEGLGSVAQWRDVPGRVHAGTGLPVFAFNRWGYGHSTTAPDGFTVRFMHTEGLDILPRVLVGASIEECVLVGHSDGGSISLIAAGSGTVRPLGVLVIAPHIYVEPECSAGIVAIESQRDRIVEGLARYHADPAATFAAWNDVWLDPEFQAWDIREYLPSIPCPVLAIQGADDEYATPAMITGIDETVPNSRGAVLVPDCGHIAHRHQPDAIVDHIVDFVTALPPLS
ncbi:MAG: alpha/beta hydrolase, partial [Acidimicrobiia bacterium]|nr:alpha/beta hydrolase [Acidimicrobiia bacterium]